MADELTPTGANDPDFAAHLATYEGFIKLVKFGIRA